MAALQQLLKQSALDRSHRDGGAEFTIYAGWQLPLRYRDLAAEVDCATVSAAIADVSFLNILDVKGSLPEFPTLPSAARFSKLSARHGWITSIAPLKRNDPSPQSGRRLEETDVSSVYCPILLAGPAARKMLRKLTTLNVGEDALPDGASGQTRLAHVNATLLRRDCGGINSFLVVVTRDVATHVWKSLLHAGEEFHASVIGIEALWKLTGWPHDAA